MENFNLIISGVGGQGIITLISIINEAAFIEGYEVKSSELHGLSQRGGSVETHIRFGKKVLSPLVKEGSVDLLIGLESMEGLRAVSYTGEQTIFLINKYFLPFQGGLTNQDILDKMPKNNLHLIPASQICKEKLQNEVVSGTYLLGYAVKNKLMPLKESSILEAIKKVIPEKYQELNIKAIELSKNQHDN